MWLITQDGWLTIRRRLQGAWEDEIQLQLELFWNIHISTRNVGTQLFENEVVRLILVCFGWKFSTYLELQRKWYRQGREWGRIWLISSKNIVTLIKSPVKAQQQQRISEPDNERIETTESEERPKRQRRTMKTTKNDVCGYNQRALYVVWLGSQET